MKKYDLASLKLLCDSLSSSPHEIHNEELLFFKSFLLNFQIPEESDDEEGLPPEDNSKILELSNGIETNPTAFSFARRAQEYFLIGRLDEAMTDSERALSLNPDSTKALRIRAQIHAKRENWKECNNDLSMAQSIDYCDDINELHKLSIKKCELLKANECKEKISTNETLENIAATNVTDRACVKEVPSTKYSSGNDTSLPDLQNLMRNIPPGILEEAQGIMKDPAKMNQILQNPMFQQMMQK